MVNFWTDPRTYTPADHFNYDCEQISLLCDQLKTAEFKDEALLLTEKIKPHLKEIEHLLRREEVFTNGK